MEGLGGTTAFPKSRSTRNDWLRDTRPELHNDDINEGVAEAVLEIVAENGIDRSTHPSQLQPFPSDLDFKRTTLMMMLTMLTMMMVRE